jgi:hypothetical protein
VDGTIYLEIADYRLDCVSPTSLLTMMNLSTFHSLVLSYCSLHSRSMLSLHSSLPGLASSCLYANPKLYAESFALLRMDSSSVVSSFPLLLLLLHFHFLCENAASCLLSFFRSVHYSVDLEIECLHGEVDRGGMWIATAADSAAAAAAAVVVARVCA